MYNFQWFTLYPGLVLMHFCIFIGDAKRKYPGII